MRIPDLPTRNRWSAWAGGLLCATLIANAHAGAQKEEALADSVRGALAAAIADNRPVRPAFASGRSALAT
jgi:hypothetical protein